MAEPAHYIFSEVTTDYILKRDTYKVIHLQRRQDAKYYRSISNRVATAMNRDSRGYSNTKVNPIVISTTKDYIETVVKGPYGTNWGVKVEHEYPKGQIASEVKVKKSLPLGTHYIVTCVVDGRPKYLTPSASVTDAPSLALRTRSSREAKRVIKEYRSMVREGLVQQTPSLNWEICTIEWI